MNNSKAIREAMCFMMDVTSGTKICFVQFPEQLDGIDHRDRYSNRNFVFSDVRPCRIFNVSFDCYILVRHLSTLIHKTKNHDFADQSANCSFFRGLGKYSQILF